ncbi:MAG TPA: hypothetical protein VNI56_00125 [Xanthomonadaceae bacterium]|nr:hypothetical protein [Xanthomonadaceae bacterium]
MLQEFVERHAKEEEKTMLPDLRKLYDTGERAEIDAQYKAWKRTNGF